MAGPISGKSGKAYYTPEGGAKTEVLDVRSWKVSRLSDNKEYASSSTAGWKKRVAGNRDWNGSFEVYTQDGDLALGFDEGDKVTLELLSDTGMTLTGPAIIDSIDEDVQVEGGDPTAATVNFSGDGEFTIA